MLYFADDILNRIFLNEMVHLVKISQKFVDEGPEDNKSVLVQLMAWQQWCIKPLSEWIMTWFSEAFMHHQGLIQYKDVVLPV